MDRPERWAMGVRFDGSVLVRGTSKSIKASGIRHPDCYMVPLDPGPPPNRPGPRVLVGWDGADARFGDTVRFL
jgi:hypothetical protein